MKLTIELKNKTIEFEVTHSNRKTFEIKIQPPDIITVRSPKRARKKDIINLMKKKENWILMKLEELKEVEYVKKEKEFIDGELFLYLGKEYPLNIKIDKGLRKPIIEITEGELYIKTNILEVDKLRKAAEMWYREKTLEIILEKVEILYKYFNVEPNSIRVKQQKKRWGSCNSKRDLMFNWRLSMAPSYVVEYIVLHEMCHMVHMDHSKKFWVLVEEIMPDYKERRKWLKKYGLKMKL